MKYIKVFFLNKLKLKNILNIHALSLKYEINIIY